MKDLYADNYETLIKDIEDNSKKGKDIPHFWTRKINLNTKWASNKATT